MAFIKKLSVGYEKFNTFEQEVKINQLPFICSMWRFLVSLLLTWNKFRKLFWSFHFWLGTSKCQPAEKPLGIWKIRKSNKREQPIFSESESTHLFSLQVEKFTAITFPPANPWRHVTNLITINQFPTCLPNQFLSKIKVTKWSLTA